MLFPVVCVVAAVLIVFNIRSQNRMSEAQEAQATALENLTREVAENKSVIASAVTLLTQLAQRIREVAFDPAQVNALAAELDGQSNQLAEAIAANSQFSQAAQPVPAPPVEEPTVEDVPADDPAPDDANGPSLTGKKK